ncbi:MAG: HTTM domain-containing protein [Bacteriovoracia bacterium]
MISWLRSQILALGTGWNYFWFDSRSNAQLTSLAIFRFCFCLVMFFFYFSRAFDVEFFYSGTGILPAWYAKNLPFFQYHPTIFTDSSPLWLLHGLHTLFLALLLSQALGLFTRFSAIGTYVLHILFLNRNLSAIFGVDMIGTFFLLYLCFANSNARYSIDAWLGRGSKRQSAASHIAWRLMQLQVCVVYGFSGLEKCKGTRWWDGSALWDILSMGNLQRWDMSFMAHAPVLLATGVYVVLFWEIYVPILVWVPRLRLPMLLFGTFMHLGIFLFMNLPGFGFMMISLYLLFLKQNEIESGVANVKNLVNKYSFIPSRS